MINVSIFVLGNLVLLKMRASFNLSKQSHPTLTSTKPQVTQGYPYRFWDGRGDICGGQGSDGGILARDSQQNLEVSQIKKNMYKTW